MAQLLDGKKVAESVYAKLLLDASLLPVVPKLVVVIVGQDPASETYVRSKTRKCAELGLRGETIQLPASTPETEVIAKIRSLNANKDVHGILLQLPLPAGLGKWKILCEIDPLKDVDGLHPENVGRLVSGEARFVPCTPAGIMEMLKFHGITVEGKKACIIGRSEIVGKPVAQLLLSHNATVTICHSKTADLAKETRDADILIAALGKKRFIKANMVKPGAVVIDVGIHREDNKLCGDVDFEAVSAVASAISPVPGGVGPMTIAMLMKNLVVAAGLPR